MVSKAVLARKKQYQERKAHGLCIECGDPVFKGTRCEYHRKKHLDRIKKNQESKRNRGICLSCPDPAEKGKLFCRKCANKRNTYVKRIIAERIENGCCMHCNEPPLPGHTLCEKHLQNLRMCYAKNKIYWKRYYRTGKILKIVSSAVRPK